MSTTTVEKSPASDVVSAEQGKLIDRTKVYVQAHAVTEQQERMYSFLIGVTLLTLKDCTPHGQFEDLKKIHFPETPKTTLNYAMQFADAVKFFSKGKLPAISDLANGDRLLTAGELSETEKQTLVEEVEKVNKGGIRKTIQAWNKKKAPQLKEPKDELHAHQEHLANIHSLFTRFEAAALALLDEALVTPIDFATEPSGMRETVAGLCVRVGKRCQQARREAKATRAKLLKA